MTTQQAEHAIAVHSRQANQFAEAYEAMGRSRFESCFTYSRSRLDRRLEAVLPPVADAERLLDVGCGTGHHLAALRKRGYEVAGVEGSTEMLVHARANNPSADLRQAEVDRLPFEAATFDRVVCVEVLRYLADPAPCIGEMARVLRPGGLCLATATPPLNLNGYRLVNRIAVTAPVPGLTRLRQFFQSPARLRRLFTDAGFEDPRIRGVYLGPVNWVQRIAPSRISRFLAAWERVDDALAGRPAMAPLTNMVLVAATRKQ
jgi:SAM-dependent methyltransferase